jgi:hypothetical protein
MKETKRLIWQGVVSELKCAPICRLVQTHYNPPRVIAEISRRSASMGEPVWEKAVASEIHIILVTATVSLAFSKDVK